MSDPKKYPSPPPDDFSKTTPNIPRADDVESNDWEKTNYNAKFAPQPPADDWGKTVANIPPIKDEADLSKTYMPGGNNPKTPDWGVTDSNIKLPSHDFSDEQANLGDRTSYGATSPFIQLPDAERAKYQNLPPTPTEAAEKKKEEEKEKKGIPGWFWAVAGMLTMFFFAIIVILLVYFIFLRPTGFEIVIQSAPSRAEVWVDNARWSVTEGDGTLRAKGLKSNELKKIEIRHPGFTCDPREIEGKDGETIIISARCTEIKTTPTPTPLTDDCQNFKKGEFEKAKRCANLALDNLKEPYSADDIAKALNLYIINFAKNDYRIKPDDMVFLEKASNYIKKLPATTVIEIGGHTDSDGTDENNMVLSNNRAKSVRDAFVNKFGINANMLTQKGYGENQPRPGNQNRNDDEKFQNRRIEYTVVKK